LHQGLWGGGKEKFSVRWHDRTGKLKIGERKVGGGFKTKEGLMNPVKAKGNGSETRRTNGNTAQRGPQQGGGAPMIAGRHSKKITKKRRSSAKQKGELAAFKVVGKGEGGRQGEGTNTPGKKNQRGGITREGC